MTTTSHPGFAGKVVGAASAPIHLLHRQLETTARFALYILAITAIPQEGIGEG
jgi:hypothetical protein